MDRSPARQLTQATRLEDVYKTVWTDPLMTPDQLRAFYRDDLNRVRGGDKVAFLASELRDAWGGVFYKSFLAGHPGVGKSTELTRLKGEVGDKFRAIRFSATNDLDPGGFKPFDVVLLMMISVVEETAKPVEQGGAGKVPPEGLLRDVEAWFAEEEVVRSSSTQAGAEASVEARPPGQSLLQRVLGLSASIKGEIKYAHDRNVKVTDYRLRRISSLLDLLNRLLVDCNDLLREATGREWLFLGEDFDKPGVPVKLIEDLFIGYANILKSLEAHAIFTIPVALVYSERATQLPFRNTVLPDTPVFHQDHREHKAGRDAVRAILEARVSKDLFGPGQMNRLVVASGGNLRDLFLMVAYASRLAILREAPKGRVEKADADRAINEQRTDYERKLGVSPFDPAPLTYAQKAERLVQVYEGSEDAKVPEPVLYSLLNARAVQEFNGERWFGVHPLVVDILTKQGRITPGEGGKVEGGAR